MAKETVNFNFAKGMDTKTDKWQLPIGTFENLQNSVFTAGGRLTKQNGYGKLSSLPADADYLTTFNGDLTAIGNSILAYNPGTQGWISKGTITTLNLSVLPIVRNNLNQSQADSVVAPNGAVCTVYSEVNNGVTSYKYVIADSATGQNITAPAVISGATGTARVFILNNYFVIAYSASTIIYYIAISCYNPTAATAPAVVASPYVPASTLSWDGVVYSGRLYFAFNTSSGGQAVDVNYLSAAAAAAGAQPSVKVTFSSYTATMMSLCVDSTSPSSPVIYVSFYNSGTSLGYTLAVSSTLATILAPTEIIASGTYLNLTSAAQNGSCTIFGEVQNAYGYDSSIPSNYINAVAISSAGVVGSTFVSVRSVGLASKAFVISGTIYFLGAYQSTLQASYFLVNGSLSTSAAPVIANRFAWENGGGYLATGLPSAVVSGSTVQIAYLYKDLIQALSTNNNTQQTTTGGIYTQTGVNLISYNFNAIVDTLELGKNLNLNNGFAYDGYLPVEQNFYLYPDNIEVSTDASAVTPTGTTTSGSNLITAVSSMVGVGFGASVSGTAIPSNSVVTGLVSSTSFTINNNATGSHTAESITVTGNVNIAQQYYYQGIYEWSDNQGNIFYSAASIPVAITTTGTTSTNAVSFPTLRLTGKTANPVKITLYRWSAAQQIYYQITSITAPLLNSTTVDSVTFYDSQKDSGISGNAIIYTAGGVVEDVAPPNFVAITAYDTRAWGIDSEDPNTLWFSKQVIEETPIEWSDLFTEYVSPNIGTIESTGPMVCIAPMDDKLIIFKANAIYYLATTNSGPDNTGANNQYIITFITSTVGCSDQQSIVLTNAGLMFQSDKGIWLLGRDLSYSYIGAPVEAFNSSVVNSANNIPATTQIRNTLSTGQTLMYDYYYQQWGTLIGVPAVSSTIYEDLHTYLDQYGNIFQETPGQYLDGDSPVLLSFRTGWINLAALQGYQRFYDMYLLAKYLSPHKLLVQVAYDYNPAPLHSVLITPNNFSPSAPGPFGIPTPFGSPANKEQWRIHAKQQLCQSFQLTVTEVFDPSFGTVAGAGFEMSGIAVRVQIKKGTRPIPGTTSAGVS